MQTTFVLPEKYPSLQRGFPFHTAGNIIKLSMFQILYNLHTFLQPVFMMPLQLCNPGMKIPWLPMSRKRNGNLIPVDFIKALEIISKRILYLVPVCNIGCNIKST